MEGIEDRKVPPSRKQTLILVSRSYNTLNADKEGEFGYGWSLDLSNTKVEVKYPAGTGGSTAFEGTLPPFRDGTRVIVTLPDGKREGFTFYGAPGTQFFGHVFDWIPKFIPDYGVTDELFTDQPRLIKTSGGEYLDTESNHAYNPADAVKPCACDDEKCVHGRLEFGHAWRKVVWLRHPATGRPGHPAFSSSLGQ